MKDVLIGESRPRPFLTRDDVRLRQLPGLRTGLRGGKRMCLSTSLLLVGALSFTPAAAAIPARSNLVGGIQEPVAPDAPTVRPAVPAALQVKINDAIDLGVESLFSRQSIDGSWTQQIEGYGSGMTGLALYALMKSGVSPSHPAIERGFVFLARHPPTRTYSRSTVALAVATRGLRADKDWLEEIVDDLARSQVSQGWGYPAGAPDLSNTQYAAMALRAGDAAGAKVPSRVWTRLADAALLYAEDVDGPAKSGYAPRGFGYRPDPQHATGSMTGAGVAILSICIDHMRSKKSVHVRALEMGRAWIDENFSVDKNPAPGTKSGNHGHHYYYLYGLERVGSLLDVETFGSFPWYRLGAEKLIGMQAEDGRWGSQSDTAFALLFLSRATGSLAPALSIGGGAAPSRWTFGADDPEQEVSLRGSGRDGLTVWVSSFGDEVRELHAGGASIDEPLPVERVEYWMEPQGSESEARLLERFDVRDAAEGARRRYAVQCELDGHGMRTVFARVYLSGKEAPLQSAPMRVRLGFTEREIWTEYALDHERNLLAGVRVEVTASSAIEGARARPTNVVDGLIGLGWKPLADDEAPWVLVELARQASANTVVLSHAELNGALLGRFELVVNERDKDRIEGTMLQDRWEKTVIDLPKTMRVRSLRIRFPDGAARGSSGLGEIELQRR